MTAIWEALHERWGAQFSREVRMRHSPVEEVALRECTGCGLLWFAPRVAGDADFYEQLMRVAPYNLECWEFDAVAARLSGTEAVADFGCGQGAFLRLIEGRASRRVGVDHNADAIAVLDEAGIEGFVGDFSTFGRRNPAVFDVGCAFQVLEHLPRVSDLLEPMLQAVRPGGRLYVAVPNADRHGRVGLEPFDCPPHHLSRWRTDQFPRLAARFGLELSDVLVEPLPYSAAVALCMRPFDRFAERLAPGVPRAAVRRAWRHAAIGPQRYRAAVKKGVFRRLGLYGHSILVELRRPRRQLAGTCCAA